MSTATSYSPIETLLLFQSLATHGTDTNAFSRTSELLNANILIRQSGAYNPSRLGPDALRSLFLSLLGEEIKSDAARSEPGNVSPSRKRKLTSPPASSIQDALQHSQKLPQLVDRLYTRYRDDTIRAIREDERRYDILQREIADIEKINGEENIANDQAAKLSREESAASAAKERQPAKAATARESPIALKAHPPQPSPKAEGLAISDVLNSTTESVIPSRPQHVEPYPQSRNGLPPRPPHSRTPSVDRPKPQPLPPKDWQWDNQFQNGTQQQYPPNPSYVPYPPQHGYNQFPPPPHRGSLPGPHDLPPPHRGSLPNPHELPRPLGMMPGSPNHVILPPPTMRRASGSPGAPLDTLADMAGQQQYRPPGPHSPSMPQPMGSPGYAHYPPPYSVRSNSSSGQSHGQHGAHWSQHPQHPQHAPPPHLQQYMPSYGPQHGSSQHGNLQHASPQHGSPQHPQHLQHSQSHPQTHPQPYYPPHPPPPPPPQAQRHPQPSEAQIQQRSYSSPYHLGHPQAHPQGQRPSLPSTSSTPRQRSRPDSHPQTPIPKPFRPSTGVGTGWTPTPTNSTPKLRREYPQPAYEPLSPIVAPVKIPAPKPVVNAKLLPVNERTKQSDTPPTAVLPAKPDIPRPAENFATSRGGRGLQRGRAGSTTSSTRAPSARSQSVISHADELSLDNEASGRKYFKQESATPRALEDVGDLTADESHPIRVDERSSSRRRGLLGSPKRSFKRKRDTSTARNTPAPQTHVPWTRNFPKISASALERIGAHRNANLFALPLKERDAPGYRDIILRPQDLKSIRSAIVAGNKAGAAILSTMEDTGAPSISLPISEDIVPPRGIVNNAQLEKELMRMFANAVMYNPDLRRGVGPSFEKEDAADADKEDVAGMEGYEVDENRVVKDTRAMFSDVEKIVSEMRAAERKSTESVDSREGSVEGGEDDVDELAGGGEEAGDKKRRRRG